MVTENFKTKSALLYHQLEMKAGAVVQVYPGQVMTK